jgi:hypothetical protein
VTAIARAGGAGRSRPTAMVASADVAGGARSHRARIVLTVAVRTAVPGCTPTRFSQHRYRLVAVAARGHTAAVKAVRTMATGAGIMTDKQSQPWVDGSDRSLADHGSRVARGAAIGCGVVAFMHGVTVRACTTELAAVSDLGNVAMAARTRSGIEGGTGMRVMTVAAFGGRDRSSRRPDRPSDRLSARHVDGGR